MAQDDKHKPDIDDDWSLVRGYYMGEISWSKSFEITLDGGSANMICEVLRRRLNASGLEGVFVVTAKAYDHRRFDHTIRGKFVESRDIDDDLAEED